MSDTTPSPLFGANADPGSQIDRNIITEPVDVGLIGLRQEFDNFDQETTVVTNDDMTNMGDPLPNETTRVARLPNKAFIPSGHLAFDKGGVYCRSRCRVRQYNKDKPDKSKVDFFILACSTTYATLSIDVNQGQNLEDVNIDKEAKGLQL